MIYGVKMSYCMYFSTNKCSPYQRKIIVISDLDIIYLNTLFVGVAGVLMIDILQK